MLGVHIDENLDWKCHIGAVIKKVGKGNYLLWRHGKKLSIANKKVLYECFVRCHLLYSLIVWGGATKTILKPLERVVSKIWSKIGPRKMHTLNRLQKFTLLKLSDELEIQECKFLWEWDNNKHPAGIVPLLIEKNDNLRGRRFVSDIKWKNNSIAKRLSSAATIHIASVSKFKSKKSLTSGLKKDKISSYAFNCRARNCFICG
jgi:hypothetical protein